MTAPLDAPRAPPAPVTAPKPGPRRLLPLWRQLFGLNRLRADLLAGLSAAAVALPLSLAVAFASGVPAVLGLVSAVVAGFVVGVSGSSRHGIGGPSAPLAVLSALVVQQHGLPGLVAVGLGCGLLQLLTGALGLSGLLRFVPIPVAAGLTAGIGGVLLFGQIPAAIGLPPPDEAHVLGVLTNLAIHYEQASPAALAVAAVALCFTLLLPGMAPALPASLLGVGLPFIAVAFLELQVPVLGPAALELSLPGVPVMPKAGFSSLIFSGVVAWLIASLSALRPSGQPGPSPEPLHHVADRELVGLGLGNLAAGLVGGVPVSAAVAHGAGAGATRASLVHALVLLGALVALRPFLADVPVAALAGVLMAKGLKLLDPRRLFSLWRFSRSEAAVFLLTFLATVVVDLTVGVQLGILAALLIGNIQLGQMRVMLPSEELPGPHRIALSGSITFLSASHIDRLRAGMEHFEPARGLVLDMSGVTALDTTGTEMFASLLAELDARSLKVALQRPRPACRQSLSGIPGMKERFAVGEADVREVLSTAAATHKDRLIHGVHRFHWETRSLYQPLFEQLAHGQKPHTLFITCADSRINPNLITSSDPGELFIVRNIGNVVPPDGSSIAPEVGAAIEYSIGVLGVREIVVCGHSSCGAMKAMLDPGPTGLPNVDAWLGPAKADLHGKLPRGAGIDEATRAHVLTQLENLRSYPSVYARVQADELRVHAWVYDVGSGALVEFDEQRRVFRAVGSVGALTGPRLAEAANSAGVAGTPGTPTRVDKAAGAVRVSRLN